MNSRRNRVVEGPHTGFVLSEFNLESTHLVARRQALKSKGLPAGTERVERDREAGDSQPSSLLRTAVRPEEHWSRHRPQRVESAKIHRVIVDKENFAKFFLVLYMSHHVFMASRRCSWNA